MQHRVCARVVKETVNDTIRSHPARPWNEATRAVQLATQEDVKFDAVLIFVCLCLNCKSSTKSAIRIDDRPHSLSK